MASVDENVEVGVELGVTAVRLTAKALIGIMEHFLNTDDRKDYYQNFKDIKENDIQGKQRVKDLFAKYNNQEVSPLEENIGKRQMKILSNELKEMGVDFSVHKVDKDSYSIFFAGKDVETIEKAMDNSIDKFLNREARKEKVKDFFSFFKKKIEEEVEEETIDEDLTEEQKEEKVNEKMEEEFVKEATQSQKDLAEELGVVDYENMNRVEISLALEEAGADRSFFRDQQNQKEKEIPEVSYDKEKVDELYERARDVKIEIVKINNYEKNIKPNFEELLADNVREVIEETKRFTPYDGTYITREDVEFEVEQEREDIVKVQKSLLESDKGRTEELPELEEKFNKILNEARKELGLSKNTKDDVVFKKMSDVFMKDNRTSSKVFDKDEKKDTVKNQNKEQKQKKKPMFSMDDINKRASEIKKESREKEKVKTKTQNRSL